MSGHSTRAHALLSASGASRWMACTPSARLEEHMPSSTSVFADEGTLAHELAEVILRYELKQIDHSTYLSKMRVIEDNDLYSDDMLGHVQTYVDYVLEVYNSAPGAEIHIEEKIDLREYIEDGFGSNDVSIVANGWIEVIDLKFGRGVAVKADNNPQLMLYGLGSLLINGVLNLISEVRHTIVQPRLDSISTWSIPAPDLEDWGENVVKPKALLAYAGEGELHPGEHCKWCKIKPKCKALADLSVEIAKKDFAEPKLLTDDELLDAYLKADLIQAWVASVKDHLLQTALAGKKWKNLKLVAGRSQRRIIDKEAVSEKLLLNGYTEEAIYTTTLKGITALEKEIGKVEFGSLLHALVEKPIGKPALVPESDPRPEFNMASAEKDFE